MKNKKIIKLLKREAKKLPVEKYEVAHKLYKPVFQDAEGNFYPEQEFSEDNKPLRRPVFRYIAEHEVNHGRRVAKYFKEFGMNAVDAYFYVKGGMVKQELIDQLESDKKMAEENI